MKRVASERPQHRQHGYVLITVLVALVLLALLAGRVDERVQAFQSSASGWERWQRGQAELASAREELLYAFSTTMLSPYGFGPGPDALRVDGRSYALPSGVRVSVQDARGLLSLGNPNPSWLIGYLAQQGVPDREIEPLLDKLADYADADDLRRLNGAERRDYAAAGLPPPRNDWPLSVHELRQVLDWHLRPELWTRASDAFTVVRDGQLNANTAPAGVLRALPGASDAGVQALLDLRQSRSFSSAEEVAALTGLRVPDDPISFFPGQFYRLRLWLPDAPGALEYTVMLTPDSPTLPWLIMEARQISQPVEPDGKLPVTPFPLALAKPVSSPADARP